jgi:hypothetical protein
MLGNDISDFIDSPDYLKALMDLRNDFDIIKNEVFYFVEYSDYSGYSVGFYDMHPHPKVDFQRDIKALVLEFKFRMTDTKLSELRINWDVDYIVQLKQRVRNSNAPPPPPPPPGVKKD